MAPVFLFGVLPAATEEARDEIIAGLAKIAEYAKANDPETTKHATHLSTDPEDQLTVYAIEEYTSQAACDDHMQWPPVLEFMEAWKANPDRLSGPPQIWHSVHLPNASFTKPILSTVEDPFVFLATLQYGTAEEVEQSAPLFAGMIQVMEKEEQGTYTYTLAKDVENTNKLTFVEVYESEKYHAEKHLKESEKLKGMMDGIIKQAVERNAAVAPVFTPFKLMKVAGFLHK